MSDLIKRMKSTLGMGVITDGDSFERSIASAQFKEAADRIEQLEASNAELRAVIERLTDDRFIIITHRHKPFAIDYID